MCLFGKIGAIGKKIGGKNDLGTGSLDLGEIGGKIGKKELVVVLSDYLRFEVEFLQTLLERVANGMSEAVILVEDIEFFLLFPDLAVVVCQPPAGLVNGVIGVKGIPRKICRALEVIGHGADVHGDDLVFVRCFIDDLHHMASVGAQEGVNLFQKGHPLANLFACIGLLHMIGL